MMSVAKAKPIRRDPHHVRLQYAQKEYPHSGHVRSRSHPDSSPSLSGFGTGVWQKDMGQCIIVGSTIIISNGSAHSEKQRRSPLSVSLFCRSHFHRRTSSSVTTLRTSSSVASLPSLTHAASGQPTRPTSPSVIQSFQKSSRHGRQKTCEHDNETQRAPLIDVRHISQLYDVCEKRACSV